MQWWMCSLEEVQFGGEVAAEAKRRSAKGARIFTPKELEHKRRCGDSVEIVVTPEDSFSGINSFRYAPTLCAGGLDQMCGEEAVALAILLQARLF